MDVLYKLQNANPQIQIRDIYDPKFRLYGRVVEENVTSLCNVAQSLPFPEEGSQYIAAVPELEELPEGKAICQKYSGGLDLQIGICHGHSNQLNALEWHACNELNIAVQEFVLLLAKHSDRDSDGRLNADKIAAFYVPKGATIELYSDTLHFCPCEVTEKGFSCIVGLPRETNLPLERERVFGETLWSKNKWLLGHEKNTGLIARGAFEGIYGENWIISTII